MYVFAAVPCTWGRGRLILMTFGFGFLNQRIMRSAIPNNTATRVICRISNKWVKLVASLQKISIVSQKGPAFFDLLFLNMVLRFAQASVFHGVQPKGRNRLMWGYWQI